jgi:diguanylate cyclase (GGDEF)-like protein
MIKIVPFVFLFLVSSKIYFTYQNTLQNEYDFANKQANAVASYALASRVYHHELFINNMIKLDTDTLKALPAFDARFISEKFNKNNALNIQAHTVSDRARNKMNKANKDEEEIIDYFRNNKLEKEYFSSKNAKHYQYAKVLRVEKLCLKCHGKREDAPLFIKLRYDKSYDYKLGDVRAIVSVKIPREDINPYFINNLFHSIFYDIIFLIIVFFISYHMLKKSKETNRFLELKVSKKTQELKKSLFMNPLTSLPNRLKLIEDIKNASVDSNLALALINIDSFKNVNDLYGFSVGDQLLNDVSAFIKNLCTENKHLYKLPNDEYALMNFNQKDEEVFANQVQSLIKKMEQTAFTMSDSNIFITLSCGIAFGQESLLIKADAALSIAQNKNISFVIYDNSLDKKEMQIKNLKSISLIKDAVKHDLIVPYFQPIYNNATKQIEKYECLARINTLDNKVLLPYEFLEVSIKGKLYHHITRAIVRKSFKFFEDKDFEFSINISINDINNQTTYEYIVDSLRNYAHPEKVVFEILETDKIENYEKLKDFIKTTKSFGCKIAIDDFGSGYSNFAHILTLNVDYLKIDSSLVKNVLNDEHSRVITQTIINFAKNLNLKTISEYVEDIESLELLEKMGSNYIQGYFIGKPKESLV